MSVVVVVVSVRDWEVSLLSLLVAPSRFFLLFLKSFIKRQKITYPFIKKGFDWFIDIKASCFKCICFCPEFGFSPLNLFVVWKFLQLFQNSFHLYFIKLFLKMTQPELRIAFYKLRNDVPNPCTLCAMILIFPKWKLTVTLNIESSKSNNKK